MQKLSRPLLDRIDISVEVKPLSFFEAADDIKEETSEVIRERVMKVHRILRVARTIAAWIFTPRASKAFQKRRGFRCFC